MKLIFMGTPEFAVTILDGLLAAGHEIAMIVTQPDRPKGRGKKMAAPPVAEYAKKHDLTFIQPSSIKDEEIVSELVAIQADAIIVAAYGRILGQQILEGAKYGCLNVHASLLPKYRGAAPIQWALRNGDKETGVSIMQLELGLDEGPIYLSESLAIDENWNKKDLFDELAKLGTTTLLKTLTAIEANDLKPLPQEHASASYAPMYAKDDAKINFLNTAESLVNLNRSLLPDDAIYTYLGDKRISLKATSYSEEDIVGTPGEVAYVDGKIISLYTGKGLLHISEIQPAGKKTMKIRDFLNGNHVEVGTVFGCSI